MLTLHDHLRPHTEEVAAKGIDGEAILINLSNGIYYSLDNVGGLIWELIDREGRGDPTFGERVFKFSIPEAYRVGVMKP
jgi:hypothetical protein